MNNTHYHLYFECTSDNKDYLLRAIDKLKEQVEHDLWHSHYRIKEVPSKSAWVMLDKPCYRSHRIEIRKKPDNLREFRESL